MKMCFNWKVLAGLGVVGVGIFLVAPELALGALPLLLLAACPISMLFMMKGMQNMGGMQRSQTAGQAQPAAQPGIVGQDQPAAQSGVVGQYTCSMHRQMSAAGPGFCGMCGMKLVPTASLVPTPAVATAGSDVALTREEQLAQLRAHLQAVGEQQAALARQIEQLDATAASAPSSKTLAEAEQIARAADTRA